MQPSDSSGLLSASAVVMAREGRLTGLIVLTDGTNVATVIIYDNASAASGKVLAKVVLPGASSVHSVNLPDGGVVANAGLYCAITGTGAAAVVHSYMG